MLDKAEPKDAYLAQGIINFPDVLRLGVEGCIIDTRVVDTIFLATRDTCDAEPNVGERSLRRP